MFNAHLVPYVDRLSHGFWRNPEADLSRSVPQFRTAIRTEGSESSVRLHFVHSLSSRANSAPLLMIPPFPFTNLSLTHLTDHFTNPGDGERDDIAFHLVIPSLPGLGFSDAINSSKHMIPLVAEMFDKLMKRLGYDHYLVTTAAPSPNAFTDIDSRLIKYIAVSFPDSCLGAHMISPPFSQPKLRFAPLAWLKWKMASTLQRPCLGYSQHDIAIIRRHKARRRLQHKQIPLLPGINTEGDKAFEPNTLSYALCDSPVGLLLFFVMVLRLLESKHEFSNQEMIHMTELTWLPGPEGTIRMWANCSSMTEQVPKPSHKPRIGVTTFAKAAAQEDQDRSQGISPTASSDAHTCLAWGYATYDVLSSQVVPGPPGLLAWERPGVIAAGVRKLAKAVIAIDGRLQKEEETGTTLLEQVTVEGNRLAPAEVSGTTIQGGVSPIPAPADAPKSSQTTAVTESDASRQNRPLTPMPPKPSQVGESSQSAPLDDGSGDDGGQSSNQGSPSTIKPFKGSSP